ncbi:MAG: [FeFe] hydrogenase H-cluster maturation GTPase HydF [Cyanobacteria bacterium SIG27]|nr:[FeFe] hydrogenase H-cluster maturation GTPase HydF [Cyanobacteria bacterium SIG27]
MSTILKSQRPHIAFFGCTNAGKSSIVNKITSQNLSVVSDIKGTTTDPVLKSMELIPIGPVVIIDTAGYDDTSELGKKRIEKTKEIINRTDVAILVIDSKEKMNVYDEELIKTFKKKNIPYIITYNKSDLIEQKEKDKFYISTITNDGIEELKEKIKTLVNENKEEKFIIKNKIKKGDIVFLVIPIDDSAPKGRLILPQQNVLREILDVEAVAICTQIDELEMMLSKVTPNLVISDSQVFNKVKDIIPKEILLTSFSILMANYKGELQVLIDGAKELENLKNRDIILISEGCTHHRQCNDIGTVKLPNWIKEHTKKDLTFEFCQGNEFPQDLSKYALIVHCGGCMLNEAEMKSRINIAKEQNKKIVNYGILIAYMNGILARAVEIFKK